MRKAICLVLISLMAVTVVARSQTARKQLAPVHWPDLTKLEEGVREQVTAEQESLAATLKNSAISDAALAEAYGKMGQVYHAYSLTSAARECYLNAGLLAPKDFRWIYLLGKIDQQEGRFDDAIREYRLARTLRPDYVAVLVNLGNIFLELNRLDEAMESFQAALAVERNNPVAHYGLGQIAISKRDYSEAVSHFETTLAQVPSATRVHYSLAMVYRGLGDAAKVKAHLAQQGTVGVRVSDPLFDGLQDLITGERVYLSRGKIAFEAKRYAEAANEFRKAVAARPDSVTARVNLGAALTQTGDLTGAAEQFAAALRVEPKNINAHYNLAVILAGQNKHEQSIAHLRSALSVEPNDLNARLLLGQELKRSGKLDEALTAYSHVVQADPGNESALLEQVKLLYRKGQFREALAGLEKSHAHYPQRGQTALLLAYLLAAAPQLDLRNGQRALELAQRVYGVTGAVQHGALVALALAETGRCSEAAEWQRRMIQALEQDRNTDLLAKLRSDLKQYENVKSCRRQNETTLSNLLFSDKN